MKKMKLNKWRRYMNMVLGINSKPVTLEDPGSRCIDSENIEPEKHVSFRSNTVYYTNTTNNTEIQLC